MHGTNGSGLLDWNDARIFLAVARHGSLRAAGRALGISQPTIGRRIAAFEAVFGGPILFDRLPEGLRLNDAGAALLPVSIAISQTVIAASRWQDYARLLTSEPGLWRRPKALQSDWRASRSRSMRTMRLLILV